MTNRSSTDRLIDGLAASPPPPPLSARGLALPMLISLVLTLGLFMVLIGPRADLLGALAVPEVAAKTLLPLAVALLALALAVQSARPARALRPGLLAVPAAAALVLFSARLMQTPSGLVVPAVLGQSALACLLSITALSVPAIGAGLMVFRRGAPPRPGLTGAMIGIASAAGAASGYALHCTEDSPLFFVAWYGVAIVAAGLGGWVCGQRMLRW